MMLLLGMDQGITRWRMILGNLSEEGQSLVSLSAEQVEMDAVLEALYDAPKNAGLGSSSPNVNRWLGDIRKYFPKEVVIVMQKDAIRRLGLTEILMQPEFLDQLEPDVHLVASLLSLNKVLPDKTKESARIVVQKIVQKIEDQLRNKLLQSVRGAINRASKNRKPRPTDINIKATIHKNIKHYQPSLKTIIPEELIGFHRQNRQMKTIILLIDQSGSMASSVVYAGIFGCVLASIKSLKTHVVVFDTAIVDLTEKLDDPVDLLFGTQIGGGTDIAPALSYAQKLIEKPNDTTLFLLSDLYDGGIEEDVLGLASNITQSGTRMVTLLALDDDGIPAYNEALAQGLTQLDIPVFAATPDQFPSVLADAIQ